MYVASVGRLEAAILLTNQRKGLGVLKGCVDYLSGKSYSSVFVIIDR